MARAIEWIVGSERMGWRCAGRRYELMSEERHDYVLWRSLEERTDAYLAVYGMERT